MTTQPTNSTDEDRADPPTPGQHAGSHPVIGRVLGWLTAGYPRGIPAQDRFAVIALLKLRLTDQQIHQIVQELTRYYSPEAEVPEISQERVEQIIAEVLQEDPSQDDIHRVSARLAAGGWPLADDVEIAAQSHQLPAHQPPAHQPPAHQISREVP